MSEMTDEQMEYEIRCFAEYPSDGAWKPYVVPFLLRLLDAERAKVARMRTEVDALEARAVENRRRSHDPTETPTMQQAYLHRATALTGAVRSLRVALEGPADA